MRDRDLETIVQPRDLLSLEGIVRVVCVAPHPDDEVLGCGGLVAALVDRGCAVHTLILTAGEQGTAPHTARRETQRPAAVGDPPSDPADLADLRREESRRAALQIGAPPPLFLDFADRCLRYGPALKSALAAVIQQHAPDMLLLPSLSEPHPDHQAVALAGLSAAREVAPNLQCVLFYECGAPLQANVHFPIDSVAHRKWRALREFTSQLVVEDYESHARAMAAMRAFGLRPPCREAESFFRVDMRAVRERGALAALPQWPWTRQSLGLANDPVHLPMVSVLVRSMNRPCLEEALASVALQTYANLEIVVVNASGVPHRALDYLPSTLPWRIVESSPGPVQRLGRASAANLALQEARGELALFLDDDDLIEPHHIERLVTALTDDPLAAGAYAGVRVESRDGSTVRVYDLPWSRLRLEGVNFLPIHAVLFRLPRVREHDICFDETLPVLEDWDFWLQVTAGAALVHCPGVSAVYRQGLGDSALGDPTHPNHWRIWHQTLLERHISLQSHKSTAESLAWHAVELDRLQSALERLGGQPPQEIHHSPRSALEQAEFRLRSSELARVELERKLEAFGAESLAALNEKEAALHRFAAEVQGVLIEREAQIQQQAREAHQALQAKDAEIEALQRDLSRQLSALQCELVRCQGELRDIYASRSWRWTAPLRRG